MALSPFTSVTELSASLQRGETSAIALTDFFLDRIDQHDGTIDSFIDVYHADAREQAAQADRERAAGESRGPLHGIPIALKDIIDIEGRITTGGSKVWADRISPVTATLAAKAREAGMIVIGKTRTVEFAMGSFGTNQHMGSPRNPFASDVHRATGGSSSGSGASVAAGLVPCAIGTDTGGSVRIPAAWCGLTGLKTTVGRISCHGVLPLASTLDTPGPMCHSVDDAALLFSALSGFDPLDRLTFGAPGEPDPWPTLDRGVEGLTFARLDEGELAIVEDDVRQSYEQSLETLAALGATVTTFKPPMTFAKMCDRVASIIAIEGYRFVGQLTDDPNQPVDDDVRPRINMGRDTSASDYMKLLEERHSIRLHFDAAMHGIDALLTPTTRCTALAVDDIDQSGSVADFTRPVNLVDYCALTVPNGHGQSGLPTGLQICCRGYDENMALQIGKCWQSNTEHHLQYPTL